MQPSVDMVMTFPFWVIVIPSGNYYELPLGVLLLGNWPVRKWSAYIGSLSNVMQI
jgi:hypothetical protein